MSVDLLTTQARYSLYCVFTLPIRDTSNFLIAPCIFEQFSSYFSYCSKRIYCQIMQGVQDSKFSTDAHYTKITLQLAKSNKIQNSTYKPSISNKFSKLADHDLYKI